MWVRMIIAVSSEQSLIQRYSEVNFIVPFAEWPGLLQHLQKNLQFACPHLTQHRQRHVTVIIALPAHLLIVV